MPTGARGEAILTDDDGEVRLLFTNRGLFELEQMIGRPAIKLLGDITGISLGELNKLVVIGLQRGRTKQAIAESLDVIDRFGFMALVNVVVDALVTVLMVSKEPITGEEDDGPPDAA